MLSVISFTETGKRLSESIVKMLRPDIEVCLYTKCQACIGEDINTSVLFVKTSVREWAGEQMQKQNAMLFIGACGIAVRAIAPFITDKLHDTPVLVMDEKAEFIIPILSGHMGGANELANELAKKIGADPVITTATDINQKFAVDLFAKRNGLFIVKKEGIVKVSSKVLAGKEITMSIEPGHSVRRTSKAHANGHFTKKFYDLLCKSFLRRRMPEKRHSPNKFEIPRSGIMGFSMKMGFDNIVRTEDAYPPAGVRLIPYPPKESVDIVITSKEDIFDTAILLKPKEYIIGMGCKRGKSAAEIEDFITKKLKKTNISIEQVYALTSISQKSDEQGLIEWCKKERVLFLTYTAEELQEIKGNFKESSFVKAHMGVGNVCERAALKACEKNGKLIAPKFAENGMTIAIAKREWTVCFYDK